MFVVERKVVYSVSVVTMVSSGVDSGALWVINLVKYPSDKIWL